MAGHSKFKNIMHRKGRQDAVRSKLFSRFSKEITVAAKMGDPDPEKKPAPAPCCAKREGPVHAEGQHCPRDCKVSGG